MAEEYARCDDGDCTKGGWPGRRKGSPTDPELKDKVYRCTSETKKKCEGTCKCFVVAIHNVDGKVKEEKAYPGAAKDDEGLLDEETRKSNYPGPNEKGGRQKDHWLLVCACLKVDKEGKPQKAE